MSEAQKKFDEAIKKAKKKRGVKSK